MYKNFNLYLWYQDIILFKIETIFDVKWNLNLKHLLHYVILNF